ncbi:TonB-dependent receptor [Sphingomonas sp. CJ99]
MKACHLFAVSALAVAAFGASPALAQDAVDPAPEEETFENAGDIIVTATRREQSIQDIPIAVTAISQTLLQNSGVQDIRGLEQLAPSIQSSTGQSSATGTTLFIRGITTAGDNPGFEPAVGVFIDGVYRPRAGVAVAELPQLERVEVLRGPQGTLFGRNTSAGALSIFTAKPKFELGGYVQAGYGNYDAYELEGALTGPVSENLALRVDAGYRKRDGYISDVNSDRAINDINRYYVRGQALFETTDVTFRLIGDYYETDENCCGAVSAARIGATNPTPAIEAIGALQGLDGLFTGDPSLRQMAISPNRAFTEKVRDFGVSGELNWDLGGVSLTSITAYRKWRALRDQDIDFSGIDRAYREDYLNRLNTFTQELRFQGSAFDGALDWLVGGFYLNETNTLRDTVRIGNDGNRYVDFLLNGATRSQLLPTGAQFYGTLGPNVPLFGQVLLQQNPIVAPPPAAGLPPIRLQQIAPAGSALFNLLTNPLPGAQPGQGNNNDDFRVKTNAIALFTHNIFNFTDELSLTLGARWNYEKKELDATINSTTGSCAFFNQVRAGNQAAATYATLLRGASANNALFNNLFLLSCNPAVNSEFNGTYADDFSDSQITGTAKLSYKVSDDVLLYGGYDRGFKSGGYNMDQATFDSVLLGGNGAQASDLQFDGETVDSFELGVKTSPLRGFTFNVAGFYSKFKDLQSLVFSGTNFVVQNVDSTTSKGVEVESTIQPDRALLIRLGYSYIDAKYDADNNFAGTPLQGQEGLQLFNQPKHTVTIATTWTPEISNGVHALFHADMRYNSEVNLNSNTPNPVTGETALRNQGYPLINARIGIQNADGTRGLEFFVENLTNEFYYITSFPVPEQTGNIAGYPGLPRFYGIQARFGF